MTLLLDYLHGLNGLHGKKTKRTQFPHFSANFKGHQNMYTCIPVYLHTCFIKTTPISAGSWLLAAGSYFRKTNPIPPFFSEFQGSPKHVYLYSCILAYLFCQNEPILKWQIKKGGFLARPDVQNFRMPLSQFSELLRPC